MLCLTGSVVHEVARLQSVLDLVLHGGHLTHLTELATGGVLRFVVVRGVLESVAGCPLPVVVLVALV